MRITYSRIGNTQGEVHEVAAPVVRIGSDPHANDIVLSSPFVAQRAAVFTRSGRHWELTPLGENDIFVDEQQLRIGERCVVLSQQSIKIFPFSLQLEGENELAQGPTRIEELDDQLSRLVLDVHRELVARMDVSDSDESRRESGEYLVQLEQDIDETARLLGFEDESSQVLQLHCAGRAVQSTLLGNIVEGRGEKPLASSGKWTRQQTAIGDLENELNSLVRRMQRDLDLETLADVSQQVDRVDGQFWSSWKNSADKLHDSLVLYLGQRYLKKQIKDILFGYGPLEDLIRMPNISEIMVVSRDKIYVEKNGVLEKSGRQFVSDDVTVSIIDRIVSRVGRRIDKSQPLVDARLIDGSRVNAVISPLALSGPCLTIRKFPAKKMLVQDLIEKKAMTPVVADFLRAAVVKGCNVLISGGTGTGKTTLLNCLSDFIPEKERIVTIEDTAELQLQKEHVVRMETKAANVEGTGEYTICDLVKNALRMRPDRVVVGECRGKEALDMLQAMNTGHDGSMTTIHANTAEDVIRRLEVLVQTAAHLPLESIHRQIASAIDLVVQLTRMRDGSRRISQITEFVAYDEQENCIVTKNLFLLNSDSVDAQLSATGRLPSFMGEMIEQDLIDLETFYR